MLDPVDRRAGSLRLDGLVVAELRGGADPAVGRERALHVAERARGRDEAGCLSLEDRAPAKDAVVGRIDAHERGDCPHDLGARPADLRAARVRPRVNRGQQALGRRVALADAPRGVSHRLVALEKLHELAVRVGELASREVDPRAQDPRLVLVAVVHAERRELVEQLARALVVLLLVAGGRGLVERLGQAIGVAGDQVVVVAGVVVPALLVGDAAEAEAGEIAHGEELLVGEVRRRRGAALRVGHLAEQVLALLGVALLDVDEPRQVRRLGPEAAPLGDGRVGGEGRVRVAGGLLRAAVHVGDLASHLFGRARRDALKVAGDRRELLALERDVDQPAHGAPRPDAARVPRSLRLDDAAQVGPAPARRAPPWPGHRRGERPRRGPPRSRRRDRTAGPRRARPGGRSPRRPGPPP